MKGSIVVRMGLAMAMALPCALLSAQTPAQAPAAGGPGAGMGQHHPPMERSFGAPGKMGRWWNNPAIIEKLKLTEAQRKQMDDVLYQHSVKLVDLHATLQKEEMALGQLIHDEQPNEGKIIAQIDKVAGARAELEKANARFLLAIRGKLTPEQAKSLEEIRAKHDDRPGFKGGKDGKEFQGGRRGMQRQGGPQGAPQGAPQGGPQAGPQGGMADAPAPGDMPEMGDQQ
jgi:protein CpxP